MAHPRHPGPINPGNPEELSVLQIAELVRGLVGSRSAIQRHPPARRGNGRSSKSHAVVSQPQPAQPA